MVTACGLALSTSGIVIGETAAASPVLTSNTLTGFINGDGVRIAAGSPVLRKNTIQGCKYGVQSQGGTPQIGDTDYNDNIITGNVHGIYAPGGSPKARNNRINGNQYGVTKTKTSPGNPDLGTSTDPGNNDLSDNTSGSPHYCIRNLSTVLIYAVGNYFGECNGSGDPPVCWSGPVWVDDNLCLPPLASRLPFGVEAVPGPPVTLHGAYPNPGHGQAIIRFSVGSENRRLGFGVYDIAGRLIRIIADDTFQFGAHELIWDGRDQTGRQVQNGLYLVRVVDGAEAVDSLKLLVVR
jgi:hypothetical protein